MKKSYHSIVVPTVLAITARRSCARCSSTDSPSIALSAVVIGCIPPAARRYGGELRQFSAKNDRWQPPLRPSLVRVGRSRVNARAAASYRPPGGTAGHSVRHHGGAGMAEEKG